MYAEAYRKDVVTTNYSTKLISLSTRTNSLISSNVRTDRTVARPANLIRIIHTVQSSSLCPDPLLAR